MSKEDSEFSQTSDNEGSLRRRLRKGDPAAIEEAIQLYYAQVLGAARANGLSRPRAEDVAQGTFATLCQKHETYDGVCHPRAFLFGILRKKVAEARRELKRERLAVDYDDWALERAEAIAGQEQHLLNSEIREAIECALDHLSEQQRNAVKLFYYDGLDGLEACDRLGVSHGSLRITLYRARSRLRGFLMGVWDGFKPFS